MRLAILALLGVLAMHAQNPLTAVYPGAVATDSELLCWKNNGTTTLDGSINDSTLTVAVVSAANLCAPGVITVGSERMKVCSISTNTLTICSGGRGFDTSSAASHSSGAAVSGFVPAYWLNRIGAEIKAIQGNAAVLAGGVSTDNALIKANGTSGRAIQEEPDCTLTDDGYLTCPRFFAGSSTHFLYTDSGTPRHDFDTSDYYYYDRTNNLWGFVIGSSLEFGIDGGFLFLNESAAPGAGSQAGLHNIYIDSTSNLLSTHENGGSVQTYVTAAATQTLTNKTIDGDSNILQLRRAATDCTAETGGKAGELCLELDDDTLYTCQPTSGDCDTAGEWIVVGTALDGCSAVAGVLTCDSFVATDSGPLELTEIAAPGAGGSAGVHNVYIDSTSNRLASHENAGSVKDYVTAADTQTLTNKTIDGESNTIQLRRASDCTAETGGVISELCVDSDDGSVFTCLPSSGDCDTAGEWVAVGGGGGGTVWTSIHFPSPSSAGVGTAEPNLGGCHLSGATMTSGQFRVFFADTGTPAIYCNFILPSFVNTGVDPKIVIGVGGSTTGTGNIRMTAKIGCYTGATDTWREPDWGSAPVELIIAKGSTAGVPVAATATLSRTDANWTEGKVCGVYLERTGENAADTFGDAVQLFGVTLEVPQ